MVRVVTYSDLEKEILNKIRVHLEEVFQKLKDSLTGGIHIRPKPGSARIDSLELNTSGLDIRQASDYLGIVNINYQNDDFKKVEDYTKFIGELMSEAVVDNYYFRYADQQIYRVSAYLWMGNNMYYLNRI